MEGTRTVILIRHADVDGPAQDGTELNVAGIARRDELPHVLGDAGIGEILVSPVIRSQQTAEAIAQHIGVTPRPVDNAHRTAGIPTMVAAIQALPPAVPVVLVVAHSHTLAGIIQGLGGPPIAPIAGDAFDHLFVLTGGSLTHLRFGA